MKSWMLLNSLISTVPAPAFRAQVVGVHSGSTLDIVSEGSLLRFRIQGVACVDPALPAGMDARDYTAVHAYMKPVALEICGYDDSGVAVGKIRLECGTDLGEALVYAGLAWWDREEAPEDRSLAAWESEARSANRGIWAEPESANAIAQDGSNREPVRETHARGGLTDLYFSSAATHAH